ncbi:MAG: VanW family protein [Abditibacteriales bacterium]|nr:VanW family protein [Abditibacteriales bacterium]MDW8365805.1 VanW family protein [Abditibacteriales bacterium]
MKLQLLNGLVVALVMGCLVTLLSLTPASPPLEYGVAAFSTSLAGRTKRQRHNIELATKALNGQVIAPQEVFSFHRVIGSTSPDRGYVKAAAYLDGELVPEFGGGVCQVSSTLYNCALLANCKIIERTRHVWRVRSVPPGLDAAVASGVHDLKFQNTLPASIRVRAEIVGDRLIIRFLSAHRLPYRVKITRQVPAVFPPAEVVEVDPSLPDGVRTTVNPGQWGCRVRVYRSLYRNGKEIHRELVSQDYYAPMNKVVRVGGMEHKKGASGARRSGSV